MKHRVFIDGSAGTTGLRIHERLSGREDIEIVTLTGEARKQPAARAEAANGADAAFLCLPDAAAREIVPLIEKRVTVLDTSTAHRTAEGWTYGLPELTGQREKIRAAKRIAVPGCHATGFIVLGRPMVELGWAPADYPFCAHSVTGYSGGGKSMIADYEENGGDAEHQSPRQYALGQTHKHLPEMQAAAGLAYPPAFNPIVSGFYSGMAVTIALHTRLCKAGFCPEAAAEALREYYRDEPLITVHPAGETPENGFLPANTLSGRDGLEIFVCGHQEQVILLSRFDNLGKGSSGAALQCMNLALGEPETAGLAL